MSDEKTPEWLEDANGEVEEICALIAHWRPVEQMMPMPSAPKPLLMHHARQLHEMGLRFHPELAVLHKVKNRKTGQPDFLSGDQKSEAEAMNEEQAQQEARDLLEQFNPELLRDLQGLSEDEKRERLDSMHGDAVQAMAQMVQLREQFGVTGASE